MKEVKRIQLTPSCNCAKQQTIFEINFSLSEDQLEYFSNNNFIEGKSYTKTGIMYIEDANLIAIGPFGSNRLQIKCKNINCFASLDILESILKNMP